MAEPTRFEYDHCGGSCGRALHRTARLHAKYSSVDTKYSIGWVSEGLGTPLRKLWYITFQTHEE
jgi:hypothetical protein